MATIKLQQSLPLNYTSPEHAAASLEIAAKMLRLMADQADLVGIYESKVEIYLSGNLLDLSVTGKVKLP
jgi:hypothetical protein